MDSISERILFLRETKGLSMNQLEDAIGAARGSVNKWEKGSIPGGKFLILLSDFFGVSTDWILKGETKVSKLKNTSTELTASDIELLAKFHQLTEKEQGKIEERIEILLELAGQHPDSSSKQESSISQNTGREDATATEQGA